MYRYLYVSYSGINTYPHCCRDVVLLLDQIFEHYIITKIGHLMNKFMRPGSLTLPAFLLIASFAFTLFSCGDHDHDHGRPPYNEDSVKNHVIPLGLAIQYTKEFRKAIDSFNKKCPGFKDSMQFGHSEAFNADSYQLLLSQKDSAGRPAAGVRIYYGLGRDGQIKLVLVPYDVNGNDILHHLISADSTKTPAGGAKTLALTDDPQAVETGQHCPPTCPPSSPLDPQ